MQKLGLHLIHSTRRIFINENELHELEIKIEATENTIMMMLIIAVMQILEGHIEALMVTLPDHLTLKEYLKIQCISYVTNVNPL